MRAVTSSSVRLGVSLGHTRHALPQYSIKYVRLHSILRIQFGFCGASVLILNVHAVDRPREINRLFIAACGGKDWKQLLEAANQYPSTWGNYPLRSEPSFLRFLCESYLPRMYTGKGAPYVLRGCV